MISLKTNHQIFEALQNAMHMQSFGYKSSIATCREKLQKSFNLNVVSKVSVIAYNICIVRSEVGDASQLSYFTLESKIYLPNVFLFYIWSVMKDFKGLFRESITWLRLTFE